MIDIDLTFSAANVILLVVATVVLIRVGAQVRQLSRSTKLLKDAADEMRSMDRSSHLKSLEKNLMIKGIYLSQVMVFVTG